MNYSKVTKLLSHLEVEQVAKESKFYLRKPRKITATNYLLSFFVVLTTGHFSFRLWAQELFQLGRKVVSFQALAKKMERRHLDFVKRILVKAMQSNFFERVPDCNPEVFVHFTRVLIEDSTCIKLAKALYKHFSGSKNGVACIAISRVQFAFDLISGKFENVSVNSYTQNDVSYADNIVERSKPGDLIIRDLGYFLLDGFKALEEKGVYFLSRLSMRINTYDPDTQQHCCLYKIFKELDKQGIRQYDQELCLGAEKRFKGRVVAFKLSEEQTAVKRKKAKQNRHKDAVIKKNTYYLQSWNIFLTNVPPEIWQLDQIYHAYSFRWEIESMFKNWKSGMNFHGLMQAFKGPNPIKPEFILHLCILFAVIVYQPFYKLYHHKVYIKKGKHLSPFKFTKFLKSKFQFICTAKEKILIDQLSLYCCYDTRKDRINMRARLYSSSLLS